MSSASLRDVLEEARRRGFLGPGPVERQSQHANDLAVALGPFQGSFLDLGTGGGLPGLVLADEWIEARAVLLDAHHRRCEFLIGAIAALGFASRVEVVCGRAEELARQTSLRGQFDLVVARSFGAPAVTAECAVGFLRVGGVLAVSEPPESSFDERRWDLAGMQNLGFGAPTYLRAGTAGAMTTALASPAAERWPRRDGIPTKRPLW